MKKINLSISESQKLLLQIIVGEDKKVSALYSKWIDSVNIESYIDGESYRMIPLLYKRLLHCQIDDQNMNRYKGIYKKSFFKNTMHLHNLLQIGQAFNQDQIPFTIIKGSAIMLHFIDDIGLRHMNDIDMVVDKKDYKKAASILEKLGFTSMLTKKPDQNLHYSHSFPFQNKAHFEIDLHWSCTYLRNQEIKLTHKKEITYKGVNLSILQANDQIINIVLHAANWNPIFIIRWIPDLYSILSYEENIDWDYILSMISPSIYSHVFFLMLSYYNSISTIKVPSYVIDQLFIASQNKKAIRHAKKTLLAPKTVFGKLKWYNFSLTHRDKNIIKRIILFPKSILLTSQYDSYGSLLSAFIRKYMLRKD